MRVVISGGGTGGHVFPALAIADEISARDPANRILFIGTARGLESEAVPSRGYEIATVSGGGVSGGGPLGALSGAFRSAFGVAEAVFILSRFSPDVAVGTGGYASFPAAAAAGLMGIPVAVCEQNAVPGLANRMLGRVARRVFLSFPPSGEVSERAFPRGKTLVTGNPVRREMAAAARNREPRKGFAHSGAPTVFVLGGSLGARALNRSVPGALGEFRRRTGAEARVIHQAGSSNVSEVEGAYRAAGVSGARVFGFSAEISRFYAESDLVISRAGAGALSELALFSKPSVLVPYPSASGGHQRANAGVMERAGAAVVIEEDGLSQKTLAGALQRLLNCNTLERMARAAFTVASPDAAARIADELEILAGK